MENPVKLGIVQKIRWYADGILAPLPLPNIHPNLISMASIGAMALIFLALDNLWWVLLVTFLSIWLDWMDGIVARQYNRVGQYGYWVDTTADRFCEGIVALAFGFPWLPLFGLNIFLLVYSLQTGTNLIMPIRLIFAVVIIFKLFGIDGGFI